jgi:outer membrane protein OmpA-like peptidoglycan-associated protein
MIRQNYLSRALAIAFLASGMAIAIVPGSSAKAGELSTQQIIDGLKVSKTRGLNSPDKPALTADDLAFVKRVRGQTRSMTLDDREHLAGIVANRPKIDIDVNFDYNSAALVPKAESQLNNLGKALTAPDLAGSVITLSGYTDAKGGEEYNAPPPSTDPVGLEGSKTDTEDQNKLSLAPEAVATEVVAVNGG